MTSVAKRRNAEKPLFKRKISSTKNEVLTVSPAKVSQAPANVTGDEYDFDSSDEEDIRNTIGNVPLSWYRKYDHIGYDTSAQRIDKPAGKSEIDKFVNKMENPDYWRTVTDPQTGAEIVLSDEMVQAVRNISAHRAPADMYEPWDEWFTAEKMLTPITAHPPSKKSFVPSKWERLAVGRMVHAIKMGRMKLRSKDTRKPSREDKLYDLWSEGPREVRRPGPPELAPPKRPRPYAPPPKRALPSHAESYNPAPEYLFDDDELERWENQEPEERKINFVPRRYTCLRLVPAFHDIYKEHFARYMDLCSAPRVTRQRVRTTPEALLPKLPNLSDLMPFPTMEGLVFRGHEGPITALSPSPCGHWLATAGADKTLRLWDVCTGYCMQTIPLPGPVESQGLVWNPSASVCLLAVATGCSVIILNPGLADLPIVSSTDETMKRWAQEASQRPADASSPPADWSLTAEGRLELHLKSPVRCLAWHAHGDYLATVSAAQDGSALLLHRVSQLRSQQPFAKPKGTLQAVLFHPRRPQLVLVTSKQIKIYDLSRQVLLKSLRSNGRQLSSVSMHKSGDHVIAGSFEGRFEWFDLDLAKTAFTHMKYTSAIRRVAFHSEYPLFAIAMDNASVIVGHGTVYNELDKNPDIYPVQILRGHASCNGLGVIDCKFHPHLPYLFTAGVDGLVKMFV